VAEALAVISEPINELVMWSWYQAVYISA